MTTIKVFTEILAWKKAHELVLSIYKTTNLFPKSELFGLTSQLRRAAASVPANIVEGFRRKNLKDSLHFYNIADASLEETKYHLLLARDLAYTTESEYKKDLSLAEETGRLLTRWIQSQRQYI